MPPALFDDVTLLITHYNRSGSVQRLLETLLAQQLRFAAIVVADDGSLPAHRQRLERLVPVYGLQLVASARNYGLGHNLNQGQAHVQTALTLYVQEDFLPTPKFGPALQQAVALMRRDAQWDLVRFFANFQYPYTTPYQGEFAAITIPPFALDYHKIYAYSDNPHLRRTTFPAKFGPYREDLPGDRTEYRMCISFIQKHGQALLHNDFQGLFAHVNTAEEPSTMQRVAWKQQPSPLLTLAKTLYRQVKYNYDLLFS
jgi:hypothetical protein